MANPPRVVYQQGDHVCTLFSSPDEPTVRIGGSFLLTNPFYELPEVAASRTANLDGVEARINQVTSAAAS